VLVTEAGHIMMGTPCSLLDYFHSAYLINLPDRTDRLSSARQQLSRIRWSERVQAFPACRFDDAGGFPSAGARGCFHSHLACLRLALGAKQGHALILEDDIAFASTLPSLSRPIRAALEATNWDFVYFGHEQTGEIARANRRTSQVRLDSFDGPILTAHFYGVNARIIPRLIDHLDRILTRAPGDRRGGPMTIDGAYHHFRRDNNNARTLIAKPKLGWQRPSRSNITPTPLDALPFAGPLASALRDLKHLVMQWRS
jgi:glycosyl transferase, family 25